MIALLFSSECLGLLDLQELNVEFQVSIIVFQK